MPQIVHIAHTRSHEVDIGIARMLHLALGAGVAQSLSGEAFGLDELEVGMRKTASWEASERGAVAKALYDVRPLAQEARSVGGRRETVHDPSRWNFPCHCSFPASLEGVQGRAGDCCAK